MAESPAAMAAERVDLPPGWRPEGVASLGDQVFVGSLADGAIYRIDAATREGEVFVPGVEGAVAVGIEADEPNGRIWVAGGDTGEVRVYAADSGDLLETYTFEGGFLNDLAFTGSAVVATDSNVAQLIVIPLGPDGSLPTPRAVGTVPVTGDLVYEEGDFGGANGIVATADPAVAIVIQSATGGLFTIDPLGGVTTAIETGGADLTAGDGMYLDGSTLYVSRNQANTITTLELDETLSSASLVSEATSEGLDIPSTLSLAGDDLWIVNARFGTEPTPETEYWLSIWPGAQQPAA
jgi:sugar lactone lactonase YvrE